MKHSFKIFVIAVLFFCLFVLNAVGEIKPGEINISYTTTNSAICPPSIFNLGGNCQYPGIKDIVLKITNLVLKLAPVALVLLIILGGFFYLFSFLGPEKIKTGHRYIQYGIIGYILLLIITLILSIISAFFGRNI
jgi:hypothetical protein